ncbi:hypothetical protein [Dysgonomonas sp. 521]|uniref:hypothetical protein n=1 Tax=Dysgonomonas sp. 521 TaxID=2302932 RepID=UPI0013D3BF4C|nr:hypothetical protein [Dysgonomonas sp. 521]
MEKSIFFLNDLTDKIVDLLGLTSSFYDWSQEEFKDNPPRLIRLQQIEAMITAFCGVGISPQSFIDGDFIRDRPLEQYADLTKQVEDFIKKEWNVTVFRPHKQSLMSLMIELLHYKERLKKVFYLFRPGTITNSSPYCQYMNSIIQSYKPSLKEILHEVDSMIERVVQPQKSFCTMPELIDCGYPDVNLVEIDFEML